MEPTENYAWFYIRDHQQQGPVGTFELTKMFEQGVLSGDTPIWKKDLPGWVLAKTLSLLPEWNTATADAAVEVPPKNYASHWEEIKKDTFPKGRPFVRYIARFFDLSLFTIFLITFISIYSPTFITQTSAFTLFLMCLALYIFVEASILSIFGNTCGKALLHAKIKTVNGERVNFVTALKRSLFVNAAGMGFGIPPLNIICFLFSYFRLKKQGKAAWDDQMGIVVLYGQVSISRIVFAGLFPVAVLIAGFLI